MNFNDKPGSDYSSPGPVSDPSVDQLGADSQQTAVPLIGDSASLPSKMPDSTQIQTQTAPVYPPGKPEMTNEPQPGQSQPIEQATKVSQFQPKQTDFSQLSEEEKWHLATEHQPQFSEPIPKNQSSYYGGGLQGASPAAPPPAPPITPTPPAMIPKPEDRIHVQPKFWKKNGRAVAKLGLFVFIIFFFGSATTVTATKMYTDQLYRATKGVLYSSPMKRTVWQSFGSVPEAELQLPVETPKGKMNQSFLLDTGAVVSSLPREMAKEMGYDLALLPRQTFKGFGNTTSFAYQADMSLYLDSKKITLPVVFTEAMGSKALLGRKGLFDKFTIVLDHKSQLVEIRE